MKMSSLTVVPESASVAFPRLRDSSRTARPKFRLPRIQVLRGRDAVLSRIGLLTEMAEGTGQSEAIRWLAHHMQNPDNVKKIPTLILVGSDCSTCDPSAKADGFSGAVLVYEYKLAGHGLKLFAGDDLNGGRAVIAPVPIRAQVAEAACNGLIEAGALAVMLTYQGQPLSWSGSNHPACDFATRERRACLHLPVGEDFDATLAMLGKHTRRNLRYYRRRVDSLLGPEFVPKVEMSWKQFRDINFASMNPVPDAIARWRFDTFATGEDMLFAGLRMRDGRWLSLIGGRRHREMTEIDWQTNLAGFPRLSLSTVMRSYLLEHEAGRGTKKLKFNGGTSHSMQHSFMDADVVDTIALRRSPAGRMLRALAPLAYPKKNFLMQALNDPGMRWVEG